MGTSTDPMLNEFRQEVATTKRVLERIPEQKTLVEAACEVNANLMIPKIEGGGGIP